MTPDWVSFFLPCTSTGTSPISLTSARYFGAARLAALEEIDVDRLPVRLDQVEHQRGAIGVAGLGEAIELVLGHDAPQISASV